MRSKVHWVFGSRDIGGVEKRLLGIALSLLKSRPSDPFELILPRELYEKVTSLHELRGLKDFEDRFRFDLISSDFTRTSRNLYRHARSLKESAIFHYVLLSPMFTDRRHHYVYTYPSTSFKKYSLKGLVGVGLGFLNSDQIDVLDPRVHSLLQSWMPHKAGRISLTPGSFVDLDHYQSQAIEEKENWLVFLGLLSREKQADRLLAHIPAVYRELSRRGHSGIRFWVMGRESDGFDSELMKKEEYKGVPVEVGFRSNPGEVLKRSKVFFSLQRTENYPSKSLLEALACKALPVVTDVGNSRWIAKESYSEFVPRDFSAEDLMDACDRILSYTQTEYSQKTVLALQHLRERFSIEKSLTYYSQIYEGASC